MIAEGTGIEGSGQCEHPVRLYIDTGVGTSCRPTIRYIARRIDPPGQIEDRTIAQSGITTQFKTRQGLDNQVDAIAFGAAIGSRFKPIHACCSCPENGIAAAILPTVYHVAQVGAQIKTGGFAKASIPSQAQAQTRKYADHYGIASGTLPIVDLHPN